jgi:hypothetical protein
MDSVVLSIGMRRQGLAQLVSINRHLRGRRGPRAKRGLFSVLGNKYERQSLPNSICALWRLAGRLLCIGRNRSGEDHDFDWRMARSVSGTNCRHPIVLRANQQTEHVGSGDPSAYGDDRYTPASGLAATQMKGRDDCEDDLPNNPIGQ